MSFNPDDSGDFTVKLTVSDEDGGTAFESSTIDVANLDPTAADASASTDADEDIVIDVLAGATDPSFVDETILTVGGLQSQMQSRHRKSGLGSGVGENIAGSFQWEEVLQTFPWERSPSDGKSSYDGRA